MTTSNDTSSNKITKRDLKSVFFRSLTMEYSWNYERQQHMGYCFSMLPIIRRVYKNKDDQAAAAKRHMEFFNTTPYVSTLIWAFRQRWKRQTLTKRILTNPPSTA